MTAAPVRMLAAVLPLVAAVAAAAVAVEQDSCAADGRATCGLARVAPAEAPTPSGGEHLLLQVASQSERVGHGRRAARGGSAGPSTAALQGVLDRHNLYRCMHGVPSMAWSDVIAANAQGWADETGGQMRHSSQDDRTDVDGHWVVGENLASGVTDAGAVDLWYDEIQHTNGGQVSGFSQQTGHYSQVVWRDSTSLGCGVNGRLLVCQYGPAGNVGGQYSAQVSGPVKTRAECEGQAPGPATTTLGPSPGQPATTPRPGTTQRPERTPGGPATTPSPTPPATTQSSTPLATTQSPQHPWTTPPPAQTTASPHGCRDDPEWEDPLFNGNCARWEIWVRLGFDCEAYFLVRDVLPARCPRACGLCPGAPSPASGGDRAWPGSHAGCSDDPNFRDATWSGTCADWQGWIEEGYTCEEYPDIRGALTAACPKACGVC